MIKNGLKSFFKSLKYFFTPFGTLALGVILGLSVAIPLMSAAIGELAASIQDIANNASLDFNALKDSFASSVGALNWSEPTEAIRSILSRDWLMNTFTECVKALVEDYEPLVAQAQEALNHCIATIVAGVVLVLFFAIVGIIAGYFVTKSLIRRTIAKRAFWKLFLATLIDSVLVTAYVVLSSYLTALWPASLIIFTLLSPFLIGIGALIEAYLLHGWKTVKAREIINVKNSFKLLLVNLLIILIAAAFTAIIVAVVNTVTGIFVGLALFEIAAIVIGMNAEAYVKDAVAQKLAPTNP